MTKDTGVTGKIDKIVNELLIMPNLLYYYTPNRDGIYHAVIKILGGNSGMFVESLPAGVERFADNLYKAAGLYSSKELNDINNHFIVDVYYSIVSKCNYSVKNYETKVEIQEFLADLDEEQLDEIENQIDMYKYARQIFKYYH